MLIDTSTCTDLSTRITYLFGNVIAANADNTLWLVVGSGRRKAGRARRYFVWTVEGHQIREQLGTLTAQYDEDAIAAANKRFVKEPQP